METKTLTLAEFLLARIAEDEAWSAARLTWTDGHFPDTSVGIRLRKECEAKRGLVEDFEILHRDYRVTHDPMTEARRFQACVTMARLASVYANHPDYREEWRP